MSTRFKHDYTGMLDEFASDDVVSVHFEAMNTNQWWVGIQTTDGRYYHIRCGATNPRAGAYCRIEQETP